MAKAYNAWREGQDERDRHDPKAEVLRPKFRVRSSEHFSFQSSDRLTRPALPGSPLTQNADLRTSLLVPLVSPVTPHAAETVAGSHLAKTRQAL